MTDHLARTLARAHFLQNPDDLFLAVPIAPHLSLLPLDPLFITGRVLGEQVTALSNAGSIFRGRSSPSVMMIRVSTPRLLILRGTKPERLKMLLVRTPAREQGT